MFWASDPSHLAQVPLEVPRDVVSGGFVDRRERSHRCPRMAMSDRAGRWVTEQVGRHARSVNEIALELGCDWHTVNDTVVAYGTALVDDDPDRFGTVEALGLDEVLFARIGPRHRQEFSTQIVDVAVGQLLDIVPGRTGAEPIAWLEAKGKGWRDQVRYATFDLSSPYRLVFTTMVPNAVQVADPFHVVKAGQHQARRVPTPGAERDHGAPWSQRRSALPLPPLVDQGRRTPR